MSRVGYEFVVRAVGQQVELVQDGVSNVYLIAVYQGFFKRIATEDIEDNRLRNIDEFVTPVGMPATGGHRVARLFGESSIGQVQALVHCM